MNQQTNLILQNKLKIFERNQHSWPNKDNYDSNILMKESNVSDVLKTFNSFNQQQKLACVISVALLSDDLSSYKESHVQLLLQLLQLGVQDSTDNWVSMISNILLKQLQQLHLQETSSGVDIAVTNSDLNIALTKLKQKIDCNISNTNTNSSSSNGCSADNKKSESQSQSQSQSQLLHHPLCVPLQLRHVCLGDKQDWEPPELGDDNDPVEGGSDQGLGLSDMKCEYGNGYLTDEFYMFRPAAFVPAVLGGGVSATSANANANAIAIASTSGGGSGGGASASGGGLRGGSSNNTSSSSSFVTTDRFTGTGTSTGGINSSTIKTTNTVGFRSSLPASRSTDTLTSMPGSGTGTAVTALTFEQLMDIKNNPKKRKMNEVVGTTGTTSGSGTGLSQQSLLQQSAAINSMIAEYRSTLTGEDIQTLEIFGARAHTQKGSSITGIRKIRLKESELIDSQGKRIKEGIFVSLNFDDNTWKKFKKSKLLDKE